MDFGLWYPKGEDFTLNTYNDSYWEGSINDRKKHQWRKNFLGKVPWVMAK